MKAGVYERSREEEAENQIELEGVGGSSKSLHGVFLQFGQLYLSGAVECISRGLNILRGGTQLN